jgi:hypothetical protein
VLDAAVASDTENHRLCKQTLRERLRGSIIRVCVWICHKMANMTTLAFFTQNIAIHIIAPLVFTRNFGKKMKILVKKWSKSAKL